MQTLFKINLTQQGGLLIPPQMNVNLRNLEINRDKMFQYHHENRLFCRSNHPLISFCETFPISKLLTYEDFRSHVLEQGLTHTRNYKWTSVYQQGRVLRNYFFQDPIKEVIIAKLTHKCMSVERNNWKDISPIKVIRHPYSHFAYETKQFQKHSGLAVMELDVGILLCQYKLFLDEQRRLNPTLTGEPLNATNFIQMYIMPHFLKSSHDVSAVNIFYNNLLSIPMTEYTGGSQTIMFNMEEYYKRTARYIIPALMRGNKSLTEILHNTGIKPMGHDFNAVKNSLLLRQNHWAYVVGLLPYLHYAVRIANNKQKTTNMIRLPVTELISRLDRDFAIPAEVLMEYNFDKEQILELI